MKDIFPLETEFYAHSRNVSFFFYSKTLKNKKHIHIALIRFHPVEISRIPFACNSKQALNVMACILNIFRCKQRYSSACTLSCIRNGYVRAKKWIYVASWLSPGYRNVFCRLFYPNVLWHILRITQSTVVLRRGNCTLSFRSNSNHSSAWFIAFFSEDFHASVFDLCYNKCNCHVQ